MLKAIGWVIKSAIFAVVVLILGNYLRVGGKTVSDQVRTQMSHAESASSSLGGAVTHVRGWADKLTGDAKKGAVRAPRSVGGPVSQAPVVSRTAMNEKEDGTPSSEEIPSSERQKLKALIRDLNTAR
jgi:hypothetical protein